MRERNAVNRQLELRSVISHDIQANFTWSNPRILGNVTLLLDWVQLPSKKFDLVADLLVQFV